MDVSVGRGFSARGMWGSSALACIAVLMAAPAAAQNEQLPDPGSLEPGADTAQDDTAELQTSAAPADAPAGGIEQIVVTARKRVETSQDVPVAVTAISPAQMARYDLSSLERVAAQTPSFSIGRSPSGSGATLVLRGIGSNTTSIGLEQSVAVIVDGIYYGQGRTINEGFFDLARLEILKGPQALFFGKNATAGVVSITTADPGYELEVIARAGYEFTAQQIIGEAIVSTPLTDTLGVRIAARASKTYDGYFDNIGTRANYRTFDDVVAPPIDNPSDHFSEVAGEGRQKEFYIRGTLKWEPSDELTATLKANFGDNRNNNPGAGSVFYTCATLANGMEVAAKNPLIPCRGWFKSSANRIPTDIAVTMPFANDDGALGNQYRSWAVTGIISYSLADSLDLTWSNNYQHNRNRWQFDADSISAQNFPTPPGVNPPLPGIFATENSTWRALSSELRLLSTFDSPFNFMIGGYFDDTKRVYEAFTASGGLENSAATPSFRRYLANSKDSQTDGRTLAAFGQAIVTPIDEVEITAGVRYTHEEKDSYFLQPYSHPIRVAQQVFVPGLTLPSSQEFSDWSPEATIRYQPLPDINIYAAYKTGYKSGGFSNSGILSGLAFNPPGGSPAIALSTFEFEPETAEGFEAGIKTLLLDRQLRFNVTGYTFKYEDLQLDFFRSDVFAFVTINAGSARTKGIEAELEFAPYDVEGLNIRSSINYNRTRYGSAIAGCWGGQTIAQGCNLVFVGPGEEDVRPLAPGDAAANRQNLAGLPTANAPKWTGTLGVTYERDFGTSLTGGISVDARYSDDYLTSAFGNPFTRQDSYVNLDASIRVGTQDDRWLLTLIGKNLTDKWYATGGTDAPNTGSGTGTATGVRADQIGFATLPRTVQLQLTFRY